MPLAISDIRTFWWLTIAALLASAVLLVALRKLRAVYVTSNLYTDHK